MASNPNVASTPTQEPLPNILQQVNFENPDTLAKKETGKAIAKQIYSEQFNSAPNYNFFAGRSVEFEELEKWSLGTQNMLEFLPLMNVSDANKSYAQLDLSPTMLGAQFVGTLTESMSKNDLYPCVTAVDGDSMDEKEERQLDALYRMHKAEVIAEMQQAAGAQLEPSGVYVPDNEMAARVYFELEDRLPKEIKFEKKLEVKLQEINFYRSFYRKLLRDSIVFNIPATKIEVLANGQYTITKCEPKKLFYNYFISDTGKDELSYIGQLYGLRIVDIRKKFNIPEEQLYNLAKKASQKANIAFPYLWNINNEIYNNNCPYDDFNVIVIDFEKKVSVSKYYVSKLDRFNKENITEKPGIPNVKSENAKIIKKDKTIWYRGVYCPDAQEMIYWGLPEIPLTDFANSDYTLSSYSLAIPHNNGRYVPSLFARAKEPLREYALTKLKRKLLLGQLAPSGYRIDVESARNIDLGNGNTIDWMEIYRIKTQTGVELWSSKGLNPNEAAPPPISAGTVDDTITKIMQLSNLLVEIANEIRILLGVPTYRDGADVGDRTAAKLAEGQNAASFNVTDYVQNAVVEVMEDTLYKCTILEWHKVINEKSETSKDLINTRFRTIVKMKLTAYEKQQLEQDIARCQQMVDANGNPSISMQDAFMVRQIPNYKLAYMYLTSKQEENRQKALKDSQQLQMQNATVQQQSNDQAAKNQQALQDAKLQQEEAIEMFRAKIKKEEIALTGVFSVIDSCIKAGVGIPQDIQPTVTMVLQNLQIPLQSENKQMVQDVIQQEHSQMAHQYAQQQAGANGQPQMQEQPAQEQSEPQQEPAQQEQQELQAQ